MKSRVPPVALAGVLVALVAGQIALSAPERSSASSTLGAFAAHGAGAAARRAVTAARREDLKQGFLVARVRRSLGLRMRPGGRVAARVGPKTDFGSPRVLAVAAARGRWLGVVTSELPNGKLGWIRRSSVRLDRVTTSIQADLSARTIELRSRGHAIARLRVAVGREGSATPTGRFAVTDELSGSHFGPYYGCCILALSGHQPSPPSGWQGGNRLAIHGTSSPGTIGAAASAGCLRAADGDLQKLMRNAPVGTPVFIHS
jgi:lipoprotein-anchoring transpeptidase ErfK/SrfK